MTRYDNVVHLVENLFGLVVDHKSITTIQRPYDSHLVTLKLSTSSNETYLVKEFLSHQSQNLQVIFSALEKIRNRKPRISIPLPAQNGLYYFTDSNGRYFQLLNFLNLSPFDQTKLSLEMLFSELKRLHLNLSQCHVPRNQYSNLHEYVVFGLKRIQRKFGADLPFLPQLKSFIHHFPIASIRQGVRHGDIQVTNVCLMDEQVIFVDCDTVHFGHPLMDYIQAAAMYLNQENLDHLENKVIVEYLWKQVKEETSDITRKDVSFLLARVLLGPIQSGDIQLSKATLTRFLNDLKRFIDGFT